MLTRHSNPTQKQHQHFNKLLNDLKIKQADLHIDYEHLHLIDNFFEPDRGREKIRVTRDEKSGDVRACMRKVRLGDLNIYSPKRHVDWRVSVNVEIPGTSSLRSPSCTVLPFARPLPLRCPCDLPATRAILSPSPNPSRTALWVRNGGFRSEECGVNPLLLRSIPRPYPAPSATEA